MSEFKGKVAIIRIGEVPTDKFQDRPCLQSCLESCRQAILDAGIKKDEIDVVMPTSVFYDRRFNTDLIFSKLVEELGLQGKAENVQVFSGGASSETMLKAACGLITAKLAEGGALCTMRQGRFSSSTRNDKLCHFH